MQEFISARRDIDEPPGTELKDYEEYAHLYSPGVDRRDQPLAALDAAERDDLRRPRHPRRLEHLAGVARRDGGHVVVARPHRGRAGVVLGLPAPRQPLARASAREDEIWQRVRRARRATTSSTSPRCSTPSPSGSTRSRRPTAGATPASSATRPGSSSSTPAPPGCSSPTSGRCSTPTRWPGSTSRCAATSTTCSSARRCRSCSPAGCTTSRRSARRMAAGAWGRRGAERGGVGRASSSTSSTGRPSRTASAGWPTWRSRSRPGQRGRAPVSVTFLSGDVHHSYVSEARLSRRTARRSPALQSRLIQAVCSPIRNPLPRNMRFATAVLSYGVAGPLGRLASRSAKVPTSPITLEVRRGAVVRQQPGVPRAGAEVAADVVGQRQGGRRRPRGAAADEGRRLRPSATERPEGSAAAGQRAAASTRPWAQVHASEHGR